MSKTLCLHCQRYLHADCSKCNLPKEYRHVVAKIKATPEEKVLGWFGGVKGK